eukprot:628519-Heterocapsa_arctica.AAC.1
MWTEPQGGQRRRATCWRPWRRPAAARPTAANHCPAGAAGSRRGSGDGSGTRSVDYGRET